MTCKIVAIKVINSIICYSRECPHIQTTLVVVDYFLGINTSIYYNHYIILLSIYCKEST